MISLKQNWVRVIRITYTAVIILMFSSFSIREWGYNFFYNHYMASSGEVIWPKDTPSQSPVYDPSRGAWLDNLNNLNLDEWDKDGKCLEATREQINYLKNEKLSEEFTFDKHRVSDFLVGKPADLDINDNKYARTYRTMLRQDLEEKGVNFAGHYSIVSVGMTGMGESYYIVDRTNGKAYPFPYWASTLDFKKDSNLIIMDSKERIFEAMRNFISYSDNCVFLPNKLVEEKPFYFLWENNILKLFGPTDIEPPINKFWEYYFD